MSSSRKPDLVRGFQSAERMSDEEMDRLLAMEDEDFERAMDALPEPEYVPSVEELMTRATEIAKRNESAAEGRVANAVPSYMPGDFGTGWPLGRPSSRARRSVSPRLSSAAPSRMRGRDMAPRTSPATWWVAAAVLGIVSFVGLTKRAELRDWIARGKRPIVEADQAGPRVPVLRPSSDAVALRARALAACANRSWDECERDLDEAKTQDPAGEGTPEVQGARALVAKRVSPAKPPVP